MTVSATTPNTAISGASASVANGRNTLAQSFDTFLTLLTTQLKNQDPTAPMDSTQFTQQLVQMTGVEQQLAANDFLKQLVTNTGSSVASAVGLIGKQVRADSADAGLSNGQASWQYNLGADAADVRFDVLDAKGNTVYSAAPTGDAAKAGDHTFNWDGTSIAGAKLTSGTYTLRITAKDAGGTAIANSTYVQGLVTGVQQDNGQTVVTVNGAKVGLNSITSVSEPPASNSAGSSTPPSNTADQTSAAAA